MSEELKPCPFCGAGETRIDEARQWQGIGYSEPISVSVRHWCVDTPGQPKRMIERIGRDRASAIAAWNRRTVSGHKAMTVKEISNELQKDNFTRAIAEDRGRNPAWFQCVEMGVRMAEKRLAAPIPATGRVAEPEAKAWAAARSMGCAEWIKEWIPQLRTVSGTGKSRER